MKFQDTSTQQGTGKWIVAPAPCHVCFNRQDRHKFLAGNRRGSYGKKSIETNWVQREKPVKRRSAWCLATRCANAVLGKWWKSWLNKLEPFIMSLPSLVFLLDFYSRKNHTLQSTKRVFCLKGCFGKRENMLWLNSLKNGANKGYSDIC